MLSFLADENLNNNIIRGLKLRKPDLDIIRIQDVEGLSGADDPDVLEWAAKENRILLTHDVATLPKYAYDRINEGKPMSGVCEITRSVPVGQAIEEILLIAECSRREEWVNQVRYLPL